MTAVDAFHAKQLAYEDMHTEAWHRFASGFTSSLRGEQRETLGVRGYQETGDEFTKRVSRTVTMAEIFYVAPLMNALVTAAAESWPEDEAVEEEDFPTPYGWLYVPGGLTTLDVRGRAYTTSVLTWAVRGGLVDVTLWADKRNDPAELRSQGWEHLPQYTPWHLTQVALGSPLPTALRMGTLLPPEVSSEIRWHQTEQGAMMTFPQGWTPDQLTPTVRPDETLAWLVSALRIMQQPLAAIERKGLPANVRRGLARRPFRVKQKAVTVIDFRRRAGDFNTGTGREYSHRFLRRGHWRRQPYKRDDGTWDRRRIWIHATIVGDPGKPLVLRNHVNALVR